jgi:hypothetical protein
VELRVSLLLSRIQVNNRQTIGLLDQGASALLAWKKQE